MPSDRDPDLGVFGVVLYYSLFIILSPVITFFGSKYVFDNVFVLTPISSNIYAALGAIVMLHVALGAYILKAYSKTDGTPEKPTKQD